MEKVYLRPDRRHNESSWELKIKRTSLEKVHIMKSRVLAIALAGVLITALIPSDAFAVIEGDQTPATEEEIAQAITNGEITTEPLESGSNEGDDISTLAASKSYAVKTLAGSDRYSTAIAQALYSYKSTETAIIACGTGYADSLSATSLAGALNCPILLTAKDSLTTITAEALRQLKVKNIIIVGSEDAISATVAEQLKAYGSVERLAGKTRFETQMEIYSYGVSKGYWTGNTVVVATGMNFVDALSISPVSFSLKAPVFFVDSKGDLPRAQQEALAMNRNIKRSLIAGSTVVVSGRTESFMQNLVKDNGATNGNVIRLGGSDRYITSSIIATYAVSNLGFRWSGVAYATGLAPYDALGGGVVQGREKAVLLLADEIYSNPKDVNLPYKASQVSSMKFFGSSAIFSNALKSRYALGAGFKLTDIEGFILYLDAGHGFNDLGTGTYASGATGNGYEEYKLNVTLSNKVATILRNKYGMSVFLNDDGGPYKYRQTEAYNLNCGAIVSIHFNASSSGGTGTESLIHSKNAALGSAQLQKKIHPKLIEGVGLNDRGRKKQAVAILSGKLPATLLEVAFIDNTNDMRVYHSRIDIVAEKIASGIAA